jgi:carbon monoxide dehydrogenase subunit G
MLFKGGVTIHVLQKKVRGFLMDSSRIGQSVPGVKKIETGEPYRSKLKVHAQIPGTSQMRSVRCS